MPINPRSAAPITIAACLNIALANLFLAEGSRDYIRPIRADDPVDTLRTGPVANCVEKIMRITKPTN